MEPSFVVSEIPESMEISVIRSFKPVPHTGLDGNRR
jgi:hypothetical protein